jgi:4-amino-4-deoxychorismate lyase
LSNVGYLLKPSPCRIEFHPYQIKIVNSIKIIHDDSIDYSHKYEDRQRLDELYSLRGECDDILIIKNGWVTDAFSSNVAFYKNKKWYTPKSPLLHGTKRAQLLNTGVLIEKEIKEKDVVEYEMICLINAMLDLGEMVVRIGGII